MSIRDIVLIVFSASLYALMGIATYLGIFAPAVGVVRFWPAVFIPAIFSEVFGPIVGGIGAAIGIFISDMYVHGNALLSLSVGVPANFIGFYLIGYILNRVKKDSKYLFIASIAIQFIPLIMTIALYFYGYLDTALFIIYTAITAIAIAVTLLALSIARRYILPRELLAYSIGLMVGSLYIGIGVWLFSQFFPLPSGERNLPVVASLLWFLWTYYTEIPFLLILTPPIVRAIERWYRRV
ncbi:conserved hypothetical protein [Ignisphaera aggregans DSM 17230]|uniref:QueT transporter family protein n=1 Tax=Ignisphaera aggregans (strain DSM 17230 / JCM 13409 / AQ1.S1) TaxID=583356 RepID=E0SRY7_IGNAA|nr:conserved hypothetical protein [Ignisphaera aggregans DSM 17230]